MIEYKKEISFIVNGEPMAKQRPRLSTFNGYARAYTPKETINYENKVLSCYKDRLKELKELDNETYFDNKSMLKVTIYAYFGLSKADYCKNGLNKSGREKMNGNHYCATHKDVDNLAKIVLDALNGIAYKDDKQIVVLNVEKYWTEGQPHVFVVMKEV